jgi:phosphoribosylamine---glycine ligase
MIRRDATHFATHPGYAVGVVLTVPPFPYQAGYAELSKGLPILFRGELSAEDRRHLHYSEVALVDGQLVTAGMVGQAMVVTGSGDTVEAAQRRAYALAERVVVPNLRYRTDIGDRFLRRDRAEMERLGLL